MKKYLCKYLVFFWLCIALVGCGNAVDEQNLPSEGMKSTEPNFDSVVNEVKDSREIIITIGKTDSPASNKSVSSLVDEFNLVQDKIWVEQKIYDSYKDMMLDVTRMQGADIFHLSGAPLEMLAEKNVIEDLTPYFERSKVISKEKIVDSVWRAGSVSDKMLYLIPRFMPCGYLVEKGYTNNGAWTIEDYLALTEKYPESMLNEDIAEPEMMIYSVDGIFTNYIDWEAKTCNFDSKEFINLLNTIKSAGEKDYQETVYENTAELLYEKVVLTQEVYLYNDWHFSDYRALRDGVLGFCEIAGIPNNEEILKYKMYYEDIYGINAASENKEAAWTFFEFLLSEEKQEPLSKSFFPARKDVLDSLLEAEISKDPTEKSFSRNRYTGEIVEELGDFTQEDKEQIMNIIDNTYRISALDMYDVIYILKEEMMYFFAGDKSAEEVARIIQSRISLFLVE